MMDLYSTDDLSWLCNWGGVPLQKWEEQPLYGSDRCVVEHMHNWMQKEVDHIIISDARLRLHRRQVLLSEADMYLVATKAFELAYTGNYM